MKTADAIIRAKSGDNLSGVVLEDIATTQVSVTDALALSNGGIVVPESNVYYDDSAIAYDEEFDDTDWSDEYITLSWEEKQALFAKSGNEKVALDVPVEDAQIKQWLETNRERIAALLTPIVSALYKAERLLKG